MSRVMNYILIWFAIVVLALSCKKEKLFAGPHAYSDDFELYTTDADLMDEEEQYWSYSQLTYDNNTLALDTTRAHSGLTSLKFQAEQTQNGDASKASIAKQNMAFWEGEVIRLSAWYFLEGDQPLDWLFLMDLEEQTAVGAGPGMRVALTGDPGRLTLEHKYPNPNVHQEVAVFPRNEWVEVVLEAKLSRKKEGWVKLYQNGTLLLEKQNWKTLPKDILYNLQGTKGMYSSIEFGITANSFENAAVLYVDDVAVEVVP